MATTWDPANKHADIDLSGGDLIATGDTTNSVNVIATEGRDVASSTGYAVEFTVGGNITTMRVGLGVGDHDLTLILGSSGATSYVAVQGAPSFRGPNNTTVSGQVSWVSGDRLLFLTKNGAIYVYKWDTGTSAWIVMKTGVDAEAETGGVWTGLTGTLFPVGMTSEIGATITIDPNPDLNSQFPSYQGWDTAGGGLLRRPVSFTGGMQDLFNGGFQQ